MLWFICQYVAVCLLRVTTLLWLLSLSMIVVGWFLTFLAVNLLAPEDKSMCYKHLLLELPVKYCLRLSHMQEL